jgi:hypothetical protein
MRRLCILFIILICFAHAHAQTARIMRVVATGTRSIAVVELQRERTRLLLDGRYVYVYLTRASPIETIQVEKPSLYRVGSLVVVFSFSAKTKVVIPLQPAPILHFGGSN